MTKEGKRQLERDVMAALRIDPDTFPEALEMPFFEEYHGNGKLTPDVGTFILRLVWQGHYYKAAAKAASVTPRTLRRWKKNGKKGIHPFDEFTERLKFADGKALLLFDGTAIEMSKKSPEMLRWMMRLRWPDIYGEATQEDGQKVVVYLPERE